MASLKAADAYLSKGEWENLNSHQIQDYLMRLITIDRVDELDKTIASIKALPCKVALRLVFDEGTRPMDYLEACEELFQVSPFIIGQIADSSTLEQYSVKQMTKRTNEFLRLLSPYLKGIEIANEINGDWCGPRAYELAKSCSKACDAYEASQFVTYFYDMDDTEQMWKWIAKHPLASPFQLVSLYPNSGSQKQDISVWSILRKLSLIFPKSSVGIGEYGAEDTNGDDKATTQEKIALIHQMEARPQACPSDDGFGGYWDWVTDVARGDGQLLDIFKKVWEPS